MRNGIKEAVDKLWIHLFGFGVPFGLLAWYGGWGTAVVLVSLRAYDEYLDWHEGRDTLGKALIDFSSQVFITVATAIVKVLVGDWC